MEWEKKTGQLLGQYLWGGTVSLLCYSLWLLPFLRFAQAGEECPHRHGQALCDQLRFHPLARNLLLTQILSHMEKSSWQGCKSWSPWNCFSEKWPKRSKKRGNTPEAPQPGARRVRWVTSPLQWMCIFASHKHLSFGQCWGNTGTLWLHTSHDTEANNWMSWNSILDHFTVSTLDNRILIVFLQLWTVWFA